MAAEGWNEYRIDVLRRLDALEESMKTLTQAINEARIISQHNAASEERKLRMWVILVATVASLVGGGVSAAGRVLMDDPAPSVTSQPTTMQPLPTLPPNFFDRLEKDIKP